MNVRQAGMNFPCIQNLIGRAGDSELICEYPLKLNIFLQPERIFHSFVTYTKAWPIFLVSADGRHRRQSQPTATATRISPVSGRHSDEPLVKGHGQRGPPQLATGRVPVSAEIAAVIKSAFITWPRTICSNIA
jgi:hypothetical protein